MVLLTILYIFFFLILSIYLYFKWTLTYWKRKGLWSPEYKKKVRDVQNEAYFEMKAKGLKHGGCYRLMRPNYIPVDLDIIQCIFVRNFDHFVNRGFYFNERDDPLSMSLVNVENENWRHMRMKLSPTFTSGKMKLMFPTMKECAQGFLKILEEHANNKTPAEMKETAARLTIDIIGSVAFGIDCKAIEDENSEFRQISKIFSQYNWRRIVAFVFSRQFLTLLRFRGRTQEVEDFFINLVKSMIHYRDSNGTVRNDFLQLLLQLRDKGEISEDNNLQNGPVKDPSSTKKYMSVTEITSQCFTFFGAGFETSSTSISFALQELALNPDIQDKLRKEIQENLKKNGGMTYEGLNNEMTYLDQVVNETLRKFPPAKGTQRVCKKAFKVPGTNFTLEENTLVYVPIFSIHRDPDIYPDPEKFDPERFTPENKAQRHPMSFLPFGEGPRMCIGFRFAYLEIKLAVATVISNYKVTLSEKTIQPMTFDPKQLMLAIKGGTWLNFSKI